MQSSDDPARKWVPHPGGAFCRYSVFDSALYRNLETKWLFPQEKATSHDLKMLTSESKML
jgi:hypothetical protein